ncbi:hypothetical protein V496_07543 [Pseudogymnoascus sp. VKM F-4515 (FW-2607)]|nr:hypothetical protein V496_07543 [Pseudogymnoascus sp. VKM F-4515 (FW-2607)]
MANLYPPLNPTQHEIRLLHLHPSPSLSSPLHGHLTHHPLAFPPPYETLSYVWGPPKFTSTITLDSYPLAVTPHLELALRHLRVAKGERVIWVDAVCINQGDAVERGEQVTLMKRIYESGRGNLVWLHPMAPTPPSNASTPTGDGADQRGEWDENTSLQWMSKTLATMEEGASLFRKIYTRDIASLEPQRRKEGDFNFHPSDPGADAWLLDNEQVKSLRRLFLFSPLWSRIWVMQELAVAARITLVIGAQTLDWGMVASFLGDDTGYADAFHMMWGHGTVGSMAGRVFRRVKTIQNQRARTQQGMKEGLLDVLARFKGCDATDPRDKIYGLLGLTTQASEMVVDYRKSAAEVYTEVAILEINRTANLDIITQNPFQAPPHYSSERHPGVPSWVPDFSCAHYDDFSSQYSSLLFAQRDIYCAGRAECNLPCAVLPGSILRLHGTVVGHVGALLFDAWEHHEYDAEEPDWKLQILHEYLRLYFCSGFLEEEGARYMNGEESQFQAFWRTLVGDCKAYPIERLSSPQIAEDDAAFRKMVRQALTRESSWYSFCDLLNCGQMMERMSTRWMFTKADNGLFLMVMEGVREGDVVVVVEGAKVPLLLRKGEGEKYTVVNAAYVHGFMDGEARRGVEEGRLSERDFLVVLSKTPTQSNRANAAPGTMLLEPGPTIIVPLTSTSASGMEEYPSATGNPITSSLIARSLSPTMNGTSLTI